METSSIREGRSDMHYFLRGVKVRGKQVVVFPFKVVGKTALGALAVGRGVSKLPSVVANPKVLLGVGIACIPVGLITEMVANANWGSQTETGGTVPWHWSTAAIVAAAITAVPFAGGGLYGLGRGAGAIRRNLVATGKADEQRRMISR